MKVEDIKRGDIITYQNGKKTYVNRPDKYRYYFNDDFYNIMANKKINKIQRYVKCLWFYKLKTLYKRNK